MWAAAKARHAPEPSHKRVVAFFDGRNLRKSARSAFGHRDYENYHPMKLARLVCARQGWHLEAVNFYIGIPGEGRKVGGETRQDWMRRAALWAGEGVNIFTRDLACDNREKGIDVRIALDVAKLVREDAFDIALIFSQDQDFREVVTEVHNIAAEQNRWLQVVSAFPARIGDKHCRGIDGADIQIPLDRGTVARCLEPFIGRKTPIEAMKKHLASLARRTPTVGGATRWAVGATAAAYLFAIMGTFGYLTYSDIALAAQVGGQPRIASEVVMMKVPPNAAMAVLWPYYWSANVPEQMMELARR